MPAEGAQHGHDPRPPHVAIIRIGRVDVRRGGHRIGAARPRRSPPCRPGAYVDRRRRRARPRARRRARPRPARRRPRLDQRRPGWRGPASTRTIERHAADKTRTDTELALALRLGARPAARAAHRRRRRPPRPHPRRARRPRRIRRSTASPTVEAWWGNRPRARGLHAGRPVTLDVAPGTTFSVLALHGACDGVDGHGRPLAARPTRRSARSSGSAVRTRRASRRSASTSRRRATSWSCREPSREAAAAAMAALAAGAAGLLAVTAPASAAPDEPTM